MFSPDDTWDPIHVSWSWRCWHQGGLGAVTLGSVSADCLVHLEIALVIITRLGQVQGNPLVLLWDCCWQLLLLIYRQPRHLIGHRLQIWPLIGQWSSLEPPVLQPAPHPGDVCLRAHSDPHLLCVLVPELVLDREQLLELLDLLPHDGGLPDREGLADLERGLVDEGHLSPLCQMIAFWSGLNCTLNLGSIFSQLHFGKGERFVENNFVVSGCCCLLPAPFLWLEYSEKLGSYVVLVWINNVFIVIILSDLVTARTIWLKSHVLLVDPDPCYPIPVACFCKR